MNFWPVKNQRKIEKCWQNSGMRSFRKRHLGTKGSVFGPAGGKEGKPPVSGDFRLMPYYPITLCTPAGCGGWKSIKNGAVGGQRSTFGAPGSIWGCVEITAFLGRSVACQKSIKIVPWAPKGRLNRSFRLARVFPDSTRVPPGFHRGSTGVFGQWNRPLPGGGWGGYQKSVLKATKNKT